MKHWIRIAKRLTSNMIRRPGGNRVRSEPAGIGPLLHGYRATCIIVTAVQLGLPERMTTPASDRELARGVGADLPSLRRLLRGLETLGLVKRRNALFALTPSGRSLVEPHARDLALLIGEEFLPAWTNLRHSVLTGEPAFDAVFGKSAWEHRREHPDINQAFNRWIAGLRGSALEALEAAFDFSRCKLAVDVGGGHGGVMAGILAKHEALNGVVFDLPHVIEGARPALEVAGVMDRCRLVGGSFFDAVPSGGDAYILRNVLHDFDDPRCHMILQRIRSAMRPEGSLLILSDVISDDRPEPIDLVMRDLHVMAVLGGRERTESEFRELLLAAGLDLVRIHSHAGAHVLEARTMESSAYTRRHHAAGPIFPPHVDLR